MRTYKLNSLLVEQYFFIINIYSYLLYLAVLSNICDNMVNIHFLQKVQFNITSLSFLKIMLQMNTGTYRIASLIINQSICLILYKSQSFNLSL
jgi:hypothetical protein